MDMDIISKLSKRERLFLYTVIFFVSFAFLDRLVIRPVESKFKQLNDEILIQRKLLGKNLRNLAQKEAVLREYKKFETYSKTSSSDEEEMAKFLREIERYASRCAVYIVDIKPQPVMNIDFYKKCVVEIEAEAGMEALIKFIYQIESSNKLLKVERLQLTSAKTTPSTIKANAVITKTLIP